MMRLSLRPYQPTDANVITTWLKNEYLMRQWCADRYECYPVTPEDMNIYHERYIDGQSQRALTMLNGNNIVDISPCALRQMIHRNNAWDSSLSMIQNVVKVLVKLLFQWQSNMLLRRLVLRKYHSVSLKIIRQPSIAISLPDSGA